MSLSPPSRKIASLKGKSKASDDEFDDLNPTITYRHIMASNLGVKDPLRVIALCDSDAFYAACEQKRLGLDPSKPLVVLQWDSLIAVNYPARTFGISRMAKLKDAKKMCPELVAVHVATYKEGEIMPGYWGDAVDNHTHKCFVLLDHLSELLTLDRVSLDYYRRESAKIINVFKEGLPNGEIEKASIDEAFIEFTQPVRQIMLERYPWLAVVPADAPDGLDSPLPPPPPILWENLGTVVPIVPFIEISEETARSSTSDDGLESDTRQEGDTLTTWHDVALSIAAELMDKIRAEVRDKLGYTTSAGIARNKFLAKLSASYKKPNSQSILRNAAIPNYLRPMAFQKIRFLGGKLGEAIAGQYDASTVGDLLTISLEEMQQKFGESAFWVYELLRGIDRSDVKEKSAQNKSMLASKNLPTPINKAADGHHWIRVLAAELTLRLNDARKLTPTLWPKSIVLHARKGYETARSKQTAFPFTKNLTVDYVANAGSRLWKDLVGDSQNMKVTSVQLAFSGLDTAEIGTQNIEGYFKTPTGARSGSSSLKRPRVDDDDEDDVLPQIALPDEMGAASPSSHTCSRCGKIIADSPSAVFASDDDRVHALERLRLEHDDMHFARDLAKESTGRPPIRSSDSGGRSGVKKKKKSGKETPGIATFFTKR